MRPGQRMMIRAPFDNAPLARLMAISAYQAGARLVDVIWEDEQLELTLGLGLTVVPPQVNPHQSWMSHPHPHPPLDRHRSSQH